MWFRVLGPVEVEIDGELLHLGRRRERNLLAILALHLNRSVSAERLCELLWDGERPAGARRSLQSHVARLRSVLGRQPVTDAAQVVWDGHGYLLRARDEQVDACRFRALVARAAEAEEPAHRAELLSSALDLWREPLPAVTDDTLRLRLFAELDELRMRAAEDLLACKLQLGRHAEVIPQLARLVVEVPAGERLIELYMTALHQVGRRADALTVYGRTRATLADELGIEPGPALRDRYLTILQEEQDGPGHPSAAAEAPAARSRPAQLPSETRAFVGRMAELAELDALLADLDADIGPVGIAAISGTAGVGKTALAMRWAHRVAERFPDGQLYLDLRGYDVEQPVTPGDALATLLRALGVDGAAIPYEQAERAATYRSLLAGRRVLVVLDNAATTAQVRPLLPGSAPCLVVVTSRDSLAGLVAREGARRLELDLLPLDAAIALLRVLIGPRVSAEPAAARALARQCAQLPLALRVAAEFAASRPAVALSGLVGELDDEQERLERMNAGDDPHTAVRAVFSWSYLHLPKVAGRMFRLLGLHPGHDLDQYAAAALAGMAVTQAGRLLDALSAAHLLRPTDAGRYAMHDLLRAYAAGLSLAHDSIAERTEALTRLLDHYTATAQAATEVLHPGAQPRPGPPDRATARPVPDDAAALAWLDGERVNLVAAVTHAAAHGCPASAVTLAAQLSRYLDRGGHFPEALTVHDHARRAAEQLGSVEDVVRALIDLGLVHWRQGRYDLAAEHFERAFTLARGAADTTGEARALTNLGIVRGLQGRYGLAIEHLTEGLARFRDIGHRVGEAGALTNLGLVHERQGCYDKAADHFQQALRHARDVGDRVAQAHTLTNLGMVYERLGRYDDAAEHLGEALVHSRGVGDRVGEANALTDLGCVHEQLGAYAEAIDHHEQALMLFRLAGDPRGQSDALNGLGAALFAAGQTNPAAARYSDALSLAVEIGDQFEEARARAGLGRARLASGDTRAAGEHWQRALALFELLDAPEADAVRADLATLAAPAALAADQ